MSSRREQIQTKGKAGYRRVERFSDPGFGRNFAAPAHQVLLTRSLSRSLLAIDLKIVAVPPEPESVVPAAVGGDSRPDTRATYCRRYRRSSDKLHSGACSICLHFACSLAKRVPDICS